MPDTTIDCSAAAGRTDLRGFISDSAADNPFSGTPTRAWDFITGAFEAFDSAQFATRYLTPLTETGTGTSIYSAAVPAGAQSAQVYHRAYVTGASAATPARAGYVNLGTAPAPDPVVTGVVLPNRTIPGGVTQQLVATVTGTGGTPSQAVTYSKQSGPGSVTSGGSLTTPAATDSAQTIFVRATSDADPTIFDDATITVPAAGASAPRDVWNPGEVSFTFTIVESCRRMDVEGDQPLLILVVPQLLNGQYLPVTDFDPEISVSLTSDNTWQAATWAPGARAALQVTGDLADTPLANGSYAVSIRIKNANGVVLRSDRLGIIDVS